jgi:hypothetical protein
MLLRCLTGYTRQPADTADTATRAVTVHASFRVSLLPIGEAEHTTG